MEGETTTPAPVATTDGSASLLAAAPAPVAAPVSTPAPSAFVNADGTFAPNWRDSLGAELKDNPALMTVPTLADLAKSYVSTKSLVGKKFQAPSESSTPEEVAAWRKIVGAPDDPAGYGELRPDDFPADQWDANTAGELAKIAHKHNLPTSAVKDIIGLHAGSVKQALEKYQADEAAYKEEGLNTLKKEWGADFAEQARLAKIAATAFGLDPGDTLDFASPTFVLAMARAAKFLPRGDTAVVGGAPSIAGSVATRIDDIRRSPEYMGERGQQAQTAAQSQLHDLYKAQQTAA